MKPIEVGCRVVCIDARFPEIGYHDCAELPRSEGVYTVESVAPSVPDVLTHVLCPGIRLVELPLPRRTKSGRPWWKLQRFRRLDDPTMPDLIVAESIHA